VARRALGRAPVLALVVFALAAVLGVYSGGVRLGTTLAPPREDAVAPRDAGPPPIPRLRSGSDPTPSTTDGPDGLPDRYEAQRPPTSRPETTAPSPSVTAPEAPTTIGPGRPATEEPAGREYPAVWPYASLVEATAHARRGDPAFLEPGATASRFARDVVGVDVTGADVRSRTATRAVVEIASAGGRTAVDLVRPGGESPGPGGWPWGVVRATGVVALDAGETVTGPAVDLVVGGTDSPVTVAVFDRRAWRGVAAGVSGPAAVRLDPGPAGRALVVALSGDPRSPSSFTVAPVVLAAGSGSAVDAPPADPVEAVRSLAADVAAGDVGATWARLDDTARHVAVDWRGLAARMGALRELVGPLATGPVATTVVATPVGSVAVVAATPGGAPTAVALRITGGAARLSHLTAHPATWTLDPADLVVSGPPRPEAVIVDGTVAAAVPDGDGLRIDTTGLDPGSHVVVAVFVVDGRATVARHDLVGTFVDDDPPSEPRSGTEASASAAPSSDA